MVVVEEDYRLGCSAKVVSEARIAQTESLHFLIQAYRVIVYYIKSNFNTLKEDYISP